MNEVHIISEFSNTMETASSHTQMPNPMQKVIQAVVDTPWYNRCIITDKLKQTKAELERLKLVEEFMTTGVCSRLRRKSEDKTKEKRVIVKQFLMEIMQEVDMDLPQKLKIALQTSSQDEWELIDELISECVKTLQDKPTLDGENKRNVQEIMQIMIKALKENKFTEVLHWTLIKLQQIKQVIENRQLIGFVGRHEQLEEETYRKWNLAIERLTDFLPLGIMADDTMYTLQNDIQYCGSNEEICKLMGEFIGECIKILQEGQKLVTLNCKSRYPLYFQEVDEQDWSGTGFYKCAFRAISFNKSPQPSYIKQKLIQALGDIPLAQRYINVNTLKQTKDDLERLMFEEFENSLTSSSDVRITLEDNIKRELKLAMNNFMKIMQELDMDFPQKIMLALHNSWLDTRKLDQTREFIEECIKTLRGSDPYLVKDTPNSEKNRKLQLLMQLMIKALQEIKSEEIPRWLLNRLVHIKQVIENCERIASDDALLVIAGGQEKLEEETKREWDLAIKSLMQLIQLENRPYIKDTLMHGLQDHIQYCGSGVERFELMAEFIGECINTLRKQPSYIEQKLVNRPIYGPNHKLNDQSFFQDVKEQVWSGTIGNNPNLEVNSLKGADIDAMNVLMNNMEAVLREARAYYPDHADIPDDTFNLMILKDSCFFLLVVLRYFGIRLDHYPLKHPIWGNTDNKNTLRMWIESMFLVGNQIPLIVLEKLMSQTFFQNLIKNNKKLEKPTGLLMKVVYEFLLAPAMLSRKNRHARIKKPTSYSKPDDLLCGLYNFLIVGYKLDLDVTDQEVFITQDEIIYPTAKEVREAGIHFKGVNGMGIRETNYEHHDIRKKVLKMPVLSIDESTELLLQNAKNHEEARGLHELRSYLKVLTNLFSTVENLRDNKVIKGKYYMLPRILEGLACKEMNLTTRMYDVMLQINDSSRPSKSKTKRALKNCTKVVAVVTPIVAAAWEAIRST